MGEPGKTVFNAGCAMALYRPDYAERFLALLRGRLGDVALHDVCCRHDPKLPAGTRIVNVCAGCDRRFRTLYEGISTVSLWEVLDGWDGLRLPDYGGARMSLHEPCPVRERPAVHEAVRSLLRKMNVEVLETRLHGTRSVCCGDDLHPSRPLEDVHAHMRKRADSMPADDVVVYCVSCIHAMRIGGKRPRHLLDLLAGEPTDPPALGTAEWHDRLQAVIDAH